MSIFLLSGVFAETTFTNLNNSLLVLDNYSPTCVYNYGNGSSINCTSQEVFSGKMTAITSGNNVVMDLVLWVVNLYIENTQLKYQIVHTKSSCSSHTRTITNTIEVPVEAPESSLCSKADLNGDGVVNILDLTDLATCYNSSESSCQFADLNNDGIIDDKDKDILSGCYNVLI
jgi:hypothetical protein